MRKYDIAHVQNPRSYYPPTDYKKMDLKALVEKYIKTCAVANGEVAKCSSCKNPCEYGKRAIQLVSNQIYNDPPIPLYGGKTMIEAAKEENMRRRREKEEAKKKEEKEQLKEIEDKMTLKAKPAKRVYLKTEEWWDKSIEYGDQVAYLVNELGFTKTKAKKAIYYYRSKHGLIEGPTVRIEEPIKEVHEEISQHEPTKHNSSNDVLLSTMENKMDELMKLQAEYKANMEKYTKLYNEVKEKIDTLCRAMDIFN